MSYQVEFENGYVAEFENEPTDEDIDEIANSLKENPHERNLKEAAFQLGEETGFNEQYAKTQQEVENTFKAIREEPKIIGKAAALGRGASFSIFQAGRTLAEPFLKSVGTGLEGIGKAYSDLPGMQWLATRPITEWTLDKVSDVFSVLSKKANELEQQHPDIAKNTRNLGDALLLMVGGKPAETAIKTAVQESKSVLKNTIDTTRGTARSIKNDIVEGAVKQGDKLAPLGTNLSESIVANINRLNPTKRQQFELQQKISPEKWLVDRGIIGTREQTITELATRFKSLRENVDEAFDKIPGTFRDKRITIVADEASEFAISTESREASRISMLAEKAKGEGLTAPEISEVKRFYERNIKTGYKKDPTKTSEQVQRATNRDSGIREAQLEIADNNGFVNLREINKEIQASKFLGDEIAGKMIGQGANNSMTLTDWIAITPGIVSPKFLAGFVTKKLLSTETVRAFAAKALAGFPKVKPPIQADLIEITKRAQEILIKLENIKVETQKMALLADELQKAGFTMSEGTKGFITKNPIPLTRQEQSLIRAAKNKEEQQQIVQYILEQRSQGNAVGEGFIIQDIDNTPILNPLERFDPNKMEPDIQI